MSLRDTIEGARREAEGNSVGRPKKEAESVVAAGDEERKGFSRSSAAKAKPSREAAASVRVATKPKQGGAPGGPAETKEQKRERKRREREEQDFRNRAYDIILRSDPGYKQSERTFWIILGCGMAFAITALVCVYLFGQEPDMSSWQGILSVGSLVVAYALIIASFFYDWKCRRPYRKAAEARVHGLSDKKMLELLERGRADELARKGEKGKKK